MPRTDRPVNLSLMQFRFPLPAIASITHRITGLLLFAALPFALYTLGEALASEAGFIQIRDEWLGSLLGKSIAWLLLVVLSYHFCAGVKHIFMDFGFFETIESARITTIAVFGATGIFAILAGVWLW